MRRPRPFNCTRRGWPVVASRSRAASISVIITSRMLAGELSTPGPAQGTVGGGGDELSQVYEKIGTGAPPGNVPGYAAWQVGICAGHTLFTTFCTKGARFPEVLASWSPPETLSATPRISVVACN